MGSLIARDFFYRPRKTSPADDPHYSKEKSSNVCVTDQKQSSEGWITVCGKSACRQKVLGTDKTKINLHHTHGRGRVWRWKRAACNSKHTSSVKHDLGMYDSHRHWHTFPHWYWLSAAEGSCTVNSEVHRNMLSVQGPVNVSKYIGSKMINQNIPLGQYRS